MIAIVDYGIGNLRSVEKAFQQVAAQARVTADPQLVRKAEGIVLPGVGAFGDGMAQLQAAGFVALLKDCAERGIPILGICLGMQLLFEESEEMGRFAGLGLLPGRVRRFHGDLKIPHIGWNQVHTVQASPLLADVPQDSHAYFVHSYYVEPSDQDIVLATTDYGGPFASIVGRGSLFGLQFHPEKSQEVGLQMLRNFARIASQRAAGEHRSGV